MIENVGEVLNIAQQNLDSIVMAIAGFGIGYDRGRSDAKVRYNPVNYVPLLKDSKVGDLTALTLVSMASLRFQEEAEFANGKGFIPYAALVAGYVAGYMKNKNKVKR